MDRWVTTIGNQNTWVAEFWWVGFTGELLFVKKVDNYYVVGSLGNVYLPTTLDDLEDFRDSLKLLFYFKVSGIMQCQLPYILILHVSIIISIYKEPFEHLWQECDACVCLEPSFKAMATSLLRLHAGNNQQLFYINRTIITQHITSWYTSNNAIDNPYNIIHKPSSSTMEILFPRFFWLFILLSPCWLWCVWLTGILIIAQQFFLKQPTCIDIHTLYVHLLHLDSFVCTLSILCHSQLSPYLWSSTPMHVIHDFFPEYNVTWAGSRCFINICTWFT